MSEILVALILFFAILGPMAWLVWVIVRWQRRGAATVDVLIEIKTELAQIRELLERRDP